MRISPFTYESFTDEEKVSPVDNEEVQSDVEVVQETVIITFDEDEMEVAQKTAYDDGFEAGKKEGIREAEMKGQQHLEEIKAVIGQIETSFQALQQQYGSAIAERQSELGKLVLTCAEKVAGEALRKDPASDIQEMINECLGGLFDSPEVVATVHPDLVETLEKSLPSNIMVTADESLQLSDCRLSWQHGEAIRDSGSLWNEVEQIIHRHFDKPAIIETPIKIETPTTTQGENNE